MTGPTKSSDHFQPSDAVRQGALSGALGLGGGFLYASTQNALSRQNRGALGVFTKSGGVMLLCTAAPALFSFTEAAVGNLREKDDHWNTAIGAFTGGLLPGIKHRRLSVITGIGAFMGMTFGVLAYTGGRLSGWQTDQEELFETKRHMRDAKRFDMEQTVSVIGEGRGICPPGYEKRRVERLKQAYGVDILPVKATMD